MKHSVWMMSLALSIACVGCERDLTDRDEATVQTPRGETTRAETQRTDMPRRDQRAQLPSTPGAAVAAISTARCEREQRCGNVGTDQDFTSNEACVAEIRRDWADELSAYECPEGVEQGELAECLEEIRNEDCASPFDTLGRVTACRSSDICNAV